MARGIPAEYHFKLIDVLDSQPSKMVSCPHIYKAIWAVFKLFNTLEEWGCCCGNIIGISSEYHRNVMTMPTISRSRNFSEGASDLPKASDLQLSNCHAVTGALKSRNTRATVVVVPAATDWNRLQKSLSHWVSYCGSLFFLSRASHPQNPQMLRKSDSSDSTA